MDSADTPPLRIEGVTEASLGQWRHVHNLIIPNSSLSANEVRERVTRHRLVVARAGDQLVGCATVRPPDDDTSANTVIVRVLPSHRRQGHGQILYAHELAWAWASGATSIETIVLASNDDGVRFAIRQGFVEVERYLLPGDHDPFITFRLP